jgi:fatty-acyl-CoA synthase
VKLLISATEFKTSEYRKMVEEVRPDCTALEDVVYIGTPDWAAVVGAAAGVTAEQLHERAAELSFDDAINIQYTSGTTGFPKGATLSHHNILNNGYFVTETIAFGPDDRLCIPVPFYHCFGMVMANLGCTTHGSCMVIPGPAFDPAATLKAVQDERCTGLYGVPTMFIAELGLSDFASYDLSSLRTGVMAGSPCPIEVMKRCVTDMHMAEVAICYGMTETSPVSTQTRRDDDLDRRTSTVGRVMPHVEVKLVDPVTGLVVPRGEPGELCTRGYSVMLGYWDEPGKTAEAIDQARWMHTGDLAVMREDGYVNIVGRIKDMVIRGGENVYPREIEEFLYTHPDIADVQVIGVPDEKYGEELCAWIKLRDGAESLDAAKIKEFATGKLAHYKIPRYVLLVDDFPMTVTGKIRKVEMREKSVTLLGLR